MRENAQRTGGEPLCRIASLQVASRRLPGTIQRCSTMSQIVSSRCPDGGCVSLSLDRNYMFEAAGSFPGAACCLTPGAECLQSGSPPVRASYGILRTRGVPGASFGSDSTWRGDARRFAIYGWTPFLPAVRFSRSMVSGRLHPPGPPAVGVRAMERSISLVTAFSSELANLHNCSSSTPTVGTKSSLFRPSTEWTASTSTQNKSGSMFPEVPLRIVQSGYTSSRIQASTRSSRKFQPEKVRRRRSGYRN